MALRGRLMSAKEDETIRQLAHSRTAPARAVERAGAHYLAGLPRPPGGGHRPGAWLVPGHGASWLKGFNRSGLAGLEEKARSGRPATYTPEQVSAVIATSLTKPQDLGRPFACWTLDRLQAYLSEVKGIAMKRTRINELLLAEGLRWRRQETWFGERVDPAFAEKRGSSRRFIRRRPQGVS
jgi:transposase